MIVGKQHRYAAVACRIDHDLSQRKVDSAGVAQVARQVDAARLIVEVRDPKCLLVGFLFGEAAGEEIAGGGDAGELERDFGTLTTHPIHLSKGAAFHDGNRVGFESEFGPKRKKCATAFKNGRNPLHMRENRIISASSKK